MFPLFLCVVIQAQIDNLDTHIAFLNNLLSEDDKMGEAGYCLVTLEGKACLSSLTVAAAFYHIATMKSVET